MGTINESLVLTDQFSSTFSQFLSLGTNAVNRMERLETSIREVSDASRYVSIQGMNEINQTLLAIEQNTRKVTRAQENHDDKVKKTDNSAKKLMSTLRGIAAVTGVSALARSFLTLSDTQTQTMARMNMMNDGLQSTAQLNEMIYQSALRSRAAYADTADAVAKMGLNAGHAFGSNQELIAFTEQVNKQFAIGGASAQAQKNAMVQLTQAMSAGALRGEELNSILDAAPGIARAIEQNMGWAAGSIKQYAEEGAVSAQVVKASLLNMAEETNQKFKEMPMTMSQAMVMMQNVVQHSVQGMASQWNDFINSADGQEMLGKVISLMSVMASVGADALSAIGQGALFVANNLDFLIPMLLGVGAILAFVKAQAIAEAAASVAGALAKAGAWALANWQILLGAALLASALIAAQQFGIGMQEVGKYVGLIFGAIYAVGYNVFASLWNVIAAFAEFFANVWDDPLGATARLFFDVFDTILGLVETVAGAIDALLGSDLQSAVAGFRNGISGWVDDTFGENAIQIKRMANLDVGATSEAWGKYGADLGGKLDNLNLNLEDLAGNFGNLGAGLGAGGLGNSIDSVGKVGKVGRIDGDIKLSDEDVKLYRDLAERRYMNKVELQTLAPQISVSIPESAAKNLTSQDIADKLKAILIEQAAAGTAVAHG